VNGPLGHSANYRLPGSLTIAFVLLAFFGSYRFVIELQQL